MADNNKVTIDVAWFDELRNTANGEKYKTLEAAYNQVREERDELKAKLATYCNECVSRDETKAVAESLAAAERCIDTIAINLECLTSWENKHKIIEDAIRAYRAQKEAK